MADSVDRGSLVASNSCSYASFYHLRIIIGRWNGLPEWISNDEVLVQNMTAINEGISFILSEGLTDVLERIDSDFASSGCDGKEINNPFGADVVFNANAFVSQYCAHKDIEIASISKEDMEALLTANKDKLYSFAFTDEEREIPPEQGDEGSGETIHETIGSIPSPIMEKRILPISLPPVRRSETPCKPICAKLDCPLGRWNLPRSK